MNKSGWVERITSSPDYDPVLFFDFLLSLLPPSVMDFGALWKGRDKGN
jgi:hypothetical protein